MSRGPRELQRVPLRRIREHVGEVGSFADVEPPDPSPFRRLGQEVQAAILGVEVIVSPFAPPPRPPTPGEDARQIVRHGMAEILKWLGEKPGPRPGELVHTVLMLTPAQAVMHEETARHLGVR